MNIKKCSKSSKIQFIRGLINANQAPKNDDDKISSKMRECLEMNKRINEQRLKINSLKDSIAKKNKKLKGKKKLEKIALNQVYNRLPDDKGAEAPLRKVSKFRQHQLESESSFLNRIEKVKKILYTISYLK